MIRKEELCAKILQFIEKNQTPYEPYISDEINIKGYTEDQIVYHLDLLEDDGFIKIENTNMMNNNWRKVTRITNTGHDVLDSIRE